MAEVVLDEEGWEEELTELQNKEAILKELIGQVLCQTIINDQLITPVDMIINETKIYRHNGNIVTIGILFCNLLNRMVDGLLLEAIPEARKNLIKDRLKLLLGKIAHPPVFTELSIAAGIRGRVVRPNIGYYFFESVNEYFNLYLSLSIKFILSNLEQLLADDYLNNGQLDLAVQIFHELSYSIVSGSYDSTYSYLLNNTPNNLINNICSYVLEQIVVANNPNWIKINLSQAGDILDITNGSLYDVKTTWNAQAQLNNIGRSDHLAVGPNSTHLITLPIVRTNLEINRPFVAPVGNFRQRINGIVVLNKFQNIGRTYEIIFDAIIGQERQPRAIQFLLSHVNQVNNQLLPPNELEQNNLRKLLELRTSVNMVFKFLRNFAPINPANPERLLGENINEHVNMLREMYKLMIRNDMENKRSGIIELQTKADARFREFLATQLEAAGYITTMLTRIQQLNGDIQNTLLTSLDTSLYDNFGSTVLLNGHTLNVNKNMNYAIRLSDASNILDLLRRLNFPTACSNWYMDGQSPNAVVVAIQRNQIAPHVWRTDAEPRVARYENTTSNAESMDEYYRDRNVRPPLCELILAGFIRANPRKPWCFLHPGINTNVDELDRVFGRCLLASRPNQISNQISRICMSIMQMNQLKLGIDTQIMLYNNNRQFNAIFQYIRGPTFQTDSIGKLNGILGDTRNTVRELAANERNVAALIAQFGDIINALNAPDLDMCVNLVEQHSNLLRDQSNISNIDAIKTYNDKRAAIEQAVHRELAIKEGAAADEGIQRKRPAEAAAGVHPVSPDDRYRQELEEQNASRARNQDRLRDAIQQNDQQKITALTQRIEEITRRIRILQDRLGLAGLNKYLKYKTKYLALKEKFKNRL
jgi:hypothetical protein